MPHIYLDAMGGDNAPACTVAGALEALRLNSELKVTLAGVLDEIKPLLTGAEDVMERIVLADTPEVITNHDAPVMAVRQKKQSAIVQGMLADAIGVQPSFFVPAACYGFILYFGLKYANLHRQATNPA